MKVQLSKRAGNASKNFRKMAVTITAAATLTFGLGAEVSADQNLKTMYYVYVNDQYVGTVSDKKLVDKAVQTKIQNAKGILQQEDVSLAVGPKLTYVQEQVFSHTSPIDDEKVMKQLEELLSIEAVGTELKIDEKHSIVVKDRESAKKVLKELKRTFVSDEELKKIEAEEKESAERLEELKKALPLKEDETRIVDVRLSVNPTISETKVKPSEMMSVSEAVQYLLKGTPEEGMYQVKEGDVLGQIAHEHSMTLEQLLKLNPGLAEDSLLKIGQELHVTVLEPLIEVIVEKEYKQKEVIPYEQEIIEDENMFKGDSKVQQEGAEGSREVTYKVSERNGVVAEKEELAHTVLTEPVKYIMIKGTKVIPSRGDGSFAWPTVGGYISSKQGQRWGKLHKGIDIARPSDRTIKTADNGIVKFAGSSGGYGNKIVIDHQNGYETVYAHLASINVKVGQTVSKGTPIGIMGSTGNSTGVHLHFEIYKNGNLENPLEYL